MKPLQNTLLNDSLLNEQDDLQLLEDSIDLFSGIQSGHMGLYVYGNPSRKEGSVSEHWSDVINEEGHKYFLPRADNDLLSQACPALSSFIQESTDIVDFGVGDVQAFESHILPILHELSSTHYYGVDVCPVYLNAVCHYAKQRTTATIVTAQQDFFDPNTSGVAKAPSLGIMMCSTIGNIQGRIEDEKPEGNLTRALKNLSRLCQKGWILVSLDTNQDQESIQRSYRTNDIAKFVLSAFDRIADTFPSAGFNPEPFLYDPQWIAENQQLAHIAVATERQDFVLGGYRFIIEKGQKFHLLNSYKFTPDFFESCCAQASLDVLRVWHHESPMKLYLLADKNNPLRQEMAAQAIA